MQTGRLTAELKQRARKLGFGDCGVCPAVRPPGVAHLDEWLAGGYAGEMNYIAERREAYDHPRHVLEAARSVVMLTVDYDTSRRVAPHTGEGRISRYAWGPTDYHDVARPRLNRLADWLVEKLPQAKVRGVIDTAPLMEREFAQLAGLGWLGKNTLLLNRDRGSWFFLAALLTDVELAYDAPYETDHCGSCRACLDTCPTDAFPQPYVLDASKCISYLTIELKQQVPSELRTGMGNWLFGCDVCQEVCPWNDRVGGDGDAIFAPQEGHNSIDLIGLFALDDAAFRERFRQTALWRPRRRGLLRNAALVLGNDPTPEALPALVAGLNDEEPLVRGACAWALGQHDEQEATDALRQRQTIESDAEVLREIVAALTLPT